MKTTGVGVRPGAAAAKAAGMCTVFVRGETMAEEEVGRFTHCATHVVVHRVVFYS
jgi:hypothetical protein